MRDEIPANLPIAAKREQREPGALDGAKCNNDFAVRRYRQRPSLGNDFGYTQAADVVHGVKPDNMAPGCDHQPFSHVIDARLADGLPRRFCDQRDGAELVEGKESGMSRLSLDGEWRFKLRFIAQRLERWRRIRQFVNAEHRCYVGEGRGCVAILDRREGFLVSSRPALPGARLGSAVPNSATSATSRPRIQSVRRCSTPARENQRGRSNSRQGPRLHSAAGGPSEVRLP